ncbi:sialidase family protein [Spirosoma daeguense]
MRIIAILACFLVYAQAFSQKAEQAFLNPPNVISSPLNYYQYAESTRKFTGIPSFAVTSGGRMWATWYAGTSPGEDKNNYVPLATSSDGGVTWEEVLVIDPDGKGPVRAYDPQLWIDPDNQLWFFWTQTMGHNGTIAGVWYMKTTDLENGKAKWSEPKRLTDGVMMDKPTVLANGDWLFPVSTWRETDNSAKVLATTDRGKSWAIRGAVNVPKEDREFDEHIIVEKKDGTLWMLVRTRYGIGESTSKDRGKTWTPLVHSKIKHPSSRFFVRRLRSGNLLLVKHGPINVQTGRSHLMAFLSKDDGSSWSKGLLLDERVGVSYPDGQQTADGTIHIIYDYNRTNEQLILTTSFTEEDIASDTYDENTLKVFKNRKVVSKGGPN